MKRRQFTGAAGAVMASAALGTPIVARSQARNVKIATIALANSPWHTALLKFKEIVDKESNGKYAVSIYTDGQLGDISRLLSQMQLGTVEFSYFGAPSLSFVKGGEVMNVAYVPYLFKSAEWAERIFNNEEFNGYYAKAAEVSGVRMFGAWGQRSPRAIQSTKGPIMKPSDVKGLRLRVPGIPLLKATFERLEAQITPMGMLEIYNALSRGAIDGQDNGFDLSVPPRFHEVAKHWSATDHAYELVGFFAGERFWKSLPDDDRALFGRAAKAAGAVTTELTRSFDIESVETLKKAGVNYVVPDRDAFRAATAGIEKEFEGKLWPAGLVDRIRKAQA